jgi:hypothetical protein
MCVCIDVRIVLKLAEVAAQLTLLTGIGLKLFAFVNRTDPTHLLSRLWIRILYQLSGIASPSDWLDLID